MSETARKVYLTGIGPGDFRGMTMQAEEVITAADCLIGADRMLSCAEDLGMIPACVPWVMEQLRILSLEIERMPKTPGFAFADVPHYPYSSVCTVSTHDMTTLRGWWRETPALTDDYWHWVLQRQGSAPSDVDGATCEAILRRQLASPSMLCILPYQDWMSISELRSRNVAAERINDPADGNHYWRYRMNMTLDDLLAVSSLNDEIRGMISASGRISH